MSVYLHGVRVDKNTRMFELLETGKPEDKKKAERLLSFCNKCEAVAYNYEAVTKLRAEFSDVVA